MKQGHVRREEVALRREMQAAEFIEPRKVFCSEKR